MDFIVSQSQKQRAELNWLLERAAKLRDQAQENAAELQEITRQIERLQTETAKPSQPPPPNGQ